MRRTAAAELGEVQRLAEEWAHVLPEQGVIAGPGIAVVPLAALPPSPLLPLCGAWQPAQPRP